MNQMLKISKSLKPNPRFTMLVKERNQEQLIIVWKVDKRIWKLAKEYTTKFCFDT